MAHLRRRLVRGKAGLLDVEDVLRGFDAIKREHAIRIGYRFTGATPNVPPGTSTTIVSVTRPPLIGAPETASLTASIAFLGSAVIWTVAQWW